MVTEINSMSMEGSISEAEIEQLSEILTQESFEVVNEAMNKETEG